MLHIKENLYVPPVAVKVGNLKGTNLKVVGDKHDVIVHF